VDLESNALTALPDAIWDMTASEILLSNNPGLTSLPEGIGRWCARVATEREKPGHDDEHGDMWLYVENNQIGNFPRDWIDGELSTPIKVNVEMEGNATLIPHHPDYTGEKRQFETGDRHQVCGPGQDISIAVSFGDGTDCSDDY
jgi:hypothetical protein